VHGYKQHGRDSWQPKLSPDMAMLFALLVHRSREMASLGEMEWTTGLLDSPYQCCFS